MECSLKYTPCCELVTHDVAGSQWEKENQISYTIHNFPEEEADQVSGRTYSSPSARQQAQPRFPSENGSETILYHGWLNEGDPNVYSILQHGLQQTLKNKEAF